MPAVSIIIPVYNVEKYLRKCLDSVLAQTLTDMEIICIDDGSTDASSEILAEYAEKDARINVLPQQNQGQSAARNNGVTAATGKYLYFLDSDDWIEPDTLKSVFDFAEENQLDEVILDFIPEYEDDVSPKGHLHSLRHEYPDISSGIDLWTKRLLNDDFIACVPFRLYRREFYLRTGLSFRQGIYHEDEIFLFLADLSAERAGCLKKQFYHYRLHSNSTVTCKPTFRHFAGLGVTYLEAAEFLFVHPANEEETLKAIAIQKDRWLYAASALMKQIPAEDMHEGCKNMPEMIQFVEMVHLYDRMMKAEYRREVQEEKMAALLNSGSYKLGHAIGKCLHLFRKGS